MFRILIVEDDLETVKILERLLRLEFLPAAPDEGAPRIDVAHTVADAKEAIANAAKPYHAVILDFKLPPCRIGDNREVDQTLCLSVRRAMPSALVGHITTHPDDKLVEEHIDRFHTERVSKNGFALSKLDNDWTKNLLRNLREFFYGSPIEIRLDYMFGEETAEGLVAALPSGREQGQSSLTHDLADLCCDIAAHWDDLNEQLQARIGRIFKLDTTVKPIRIGLL
jgi:CheY-like chemotaxis protein